MTPLQAEMLAQSMALIGSVIALEFLEFDNPDKLVAWQATIAKEMRKAFRAQLTSAKLVSNDRPPLKHPPIKDTTIN